jgi:hypothetical protein
MKYQLLIGYTVRYQHYNCTTPVVSWALVKRKTAPTLQVKLGRHPDEREEQEEKTERIGTEIREMREEGN